jgi:drug/metabolite transporter (DMT)-like permease
VTARGSILAAGAFALVGSLVAASDSVESYPLAEGQFLRYLLAAAVLLAVARGRLPRLSAREALGLVALAATGLVLFNVFVIEGVRETDPATVGVIVGCVPVVLAFAGPLLARRPISGRVVVAAVVVAAGAAGVQWSNGGITPAGLLLALGALGCEAAFSLLAAPHLARLGALAVSAYACLLALPLLLAWSILAGGPELPAPSAEEAAALAYLAVAVTAGGFLAWYSAVRILGVERAGLFSGVLPVSALACSAAIGAAEVTPARLAAVVIVAAGITLGVRATNASRPTRAPRQTAALMRGADRPSRRDTHPGRPDRGDPQPSRRTVGSPRPGGRSPHAPRRATQGGRDGRPEHAA